MGSRAAGTPICVSSRSQAHQCRRGSVMDVVLHHKTVNLNAVKLKLLASSATCIVSPSKVHSGRHNRETQSGDVPLRRRQTVRYYPRPGTPGAGDECSAAPTGKRSIAKALARDGMLGMSAPNSRASESHRRWRPSVTALALATRTLSSRLDSVSRLGQIFSAFVSRVLGLNTSLFCCCDQRCQTLT